MSANRVPLLASLLAAAIVISALGIALQVGAQRLGDARTRIEDYQARIARLGQALPPESEILALRDSLQSERADRISRFYGRDEINAYAFGTLVKKELAGLGLAVIRYQVVEVSGRSFIEFNVSGPARSMVLFLQYVSQAEKYWTIPYLTLSMRGSDADAVFRIGYEVLDPNS